jgi:hypothetical protein
VPLELVPQPTAKILFSQLSLSSVQKCIRDSNNLEKRANGPGTRYSRQNEPFRRCLKSCLLCLQGCQGHLRRETLDKKMNERKTRKTGADDSDRKHLTGREVDRLIEAAVAFSSDTPGASVLSMAAQTRGEANISPPTVRLESLIS